MSYIIKQNLLDRFSEQEIIQLTDRILPATGVVVDAVLNQAIADADAEINSYLTAYPLPLAVVPANLVRIACDITRYYLYDDAVTDQVRARYEDAIKYLSQIAKGMISLAPSSGGTIADTTVSTVEFASTESAFSRNNY